MQKSQLKKRIYFFHRILKFMGQSNLKKIQSCVLDLQENNDIVGEEAEKFVKEYVNSGERIKDVNKFIDRPSTQLLLKHFISYHYRQPEKKTKRTPLILPNSGGAKLYNYEEIIDASSVLLDKKYKLTVQTIKDVFIEESSIQKVKEIFNLNIHNLLSLNGFSLYGVELSNRSVFFKNSRIHFITEIDSKDQVYGKIFRRVDANESLLFSDLSKIPQDNQGQYIEITMKNEKYLGIFLFELDMASWPKIKEESLIHQFLKISSEIIIEFLFSSQRQNFFLIPRANLCKNSKIIKQYIESALNLLDISLKLENQKLNQKISLNRDKVFDILNDKNYENSEAFFKRITELSGKVQTYKRELNKENQIYLSFDRFGILQFIYSDKPNHAIVDYIRKSAQNSSIKVVDVFQDQKKVLKLIQCAAKGLIESKVVDIDSSFKIHFVTNQRGSLSYLSIYLYLEQEKNLVNSMRFKKTQRRSSQEENYNCIVRKMCEKSPNFMKSGWFKVFLSQQITEVQPLSNQTNLSQAKKRGAKKINKYEAFNEVMQLRGSIDVESEGLNVLEYNKKQIQLLVIKVFSRLSFFTHLPHEHDEFPEFLKQLQENYDKNNNSFHNFLHGVNVMHLSFLITIGKKVKNILSPLQIFTTVFSALCHDVGHRARTNLFEIASGSKLACLYNNNSPLQNYHASKSFEILRKPRKNFLASLSNKMFSEFRRQFINNVLHTDIKQHFPLVKKFEQQMDKISSSNTLLLTNIIVHASDFAGIVKNFDICKAWSERLNEEFLQQYEDEANLGLPQSNFIKDLNNRKGRAKNEMGFIKVIVTPLYENLFEFTEKDRKIEIMLKEAKSNNQEWEKIYQTECLQADKIFI